MSDLGWLSLFAIDVKNSYLAVVQDISVTVKLLPPTLSKTKVRSNDLKPVALDPTSCESYIAHG